MPREFKRSDRVASQIKREMADLIRVGVKDPELGMVTVSDAELLDDALEPEDLLYRLFHTEGVAADFSRALAYGYRCSRRRLSGLLETFSEDDLDHMAIDGEIVMTCEFCNHDFRFPRADVRRADAS